MGKKYKVSRKTWVNKAEERSSLESVELKVPCKSEGLIVEGEIELHNVMGQEDVYRTDPITDERTETNTLIGRIVFSTGIQSTAVVHYGPSFYGPVNTFDVVEADDHHEVFIPDLNPNTLYVFYVVATPANTNDDPIQSGLYYFETSGEVNEGAIAQIWTDVEMKTKLGIDVEVTGVTATYNLVTQPLYQEILFTAATQVLALTTASITDTPTETSVDFIIS